MFIGMTAGRKSSEFFLKGEGSVRKDQEEQHAQMVLWGKGLNEWRSVIQTGEHDFDEKCHW